MHTGQTSSLVLKPVPNFTCRPTVDDLKIYWTTWFEEILVRRSHSSAIWRDRLTHMHTNLGCSKKSWTSFCLKWIYQLWFLLILDGNGCFLVQLWCNRCTREQKLLFYLLCHLKHQSECKRHDVRSLSGTFFFLSSFFSHTHQVFWLSYKQRTTQKVIWTDIVQAYTRGANSTTTDSGHDCVNRYEQAVSGGQSVIHPESESRGWKGSSADNCEDLR